jgi:NmrA-like family
LANYNPDYKVDHFNGKGAVADFLNAQSSVASGTDLSWTTISTGVYLEMLNHVSPMPSLPCALGDAVIQPLVGPLNKRPDGTFVFAAPIRDGHMAFVALSDIGWWARYIFDHRNETSGEHLKVASDMVSWDYLVSTFTKVTGQPAVFKRQELDEWWLNFDGADIALASDLRGAQIPATTMRQNFSAFWRQWRDGIIKRDMEWIRKIHPTGHTLESWLIATGYNGEVGVGVRKRDEQMNGGFRPNREICSIL